RAVHSIKGGAGAFHLEDLVHFAHAFETTLDRLRSRQLEVTPLCSKVMLRSADMLADLVRVARDGGDVDQQRRLALIDELGALTGQAPKAAAAPEPVVAAMPVSAPVLAADDDMAGFEFQPVAVSLDDLASFDERLASPGHKTFEISFKPRPELYAKANESGLL